MSDTITSRKLERGGGVGGGGVGWGGKNYFGTADEVRAHGYQSCEAAMAQEYHTLRVPRFIS